MQNNYKQTRLKLTLLYILIITGICVFFSTVFIVNQFNQFSKYEVFRGQVRDNPQLLPFSSTVKRIDSIVDDIKFNVVVNTLIIDGVIISLSAFLSYYLAGKTLAPIMEAFEKQKRFISDASHEIRTPLATIKSEAEVLLRSNETTNDEYKNFGRSTIEEIDRLTSLTNHMLDLAKSDNSSLDIKKEKVNLYTICNDSREKFLTLAKNKSLDLNFSSDVESIFVFANKVRLEQLMAILIDNAVKYTKEGQIDINLFYNEDKKPVISIIDTGIGINKENINKVFDRFYREAKDRSSSGFGLGLSIAKEICKENSIELTISSTLAIGTRVDLKFFEIS